MTNNESELDLNGAKPLAFNLELLRQNYGRHVLTQEDLATMTGVPRLRLSRYERLSDVPSVLKDLVAVSYALGIPNVEALIAPEAREAILEEVDQFRDLRGLPPLRPPHSPAIGFHPEV
jgi:transcriptional regulator with XRE-family HTH domain